MCFSIRSLCFTFTLSACLLSALSAEPVKENARWWKGNLHTHSLWSDGDDYPEMIADWYKQRGYHFLAISDHNTTADQVRWVLVNKTRGGDGAFAKYLERFGPSWVEQRGEAEKHEVRLKHFAEYRKPFEESGRFLMIPSEEITAKTVHINATNIQELILPYTSFDPNDSGGIVGAMQRTFNAVAEQRQRTGIPMFAHLNHPNFKWGITAEEMMRIDGERFFEVYNGHPEVNNEGDATHASTDRLWDIVLTERLARLNKPAVLGLATDDSHHYHSDAPKKSRPGRGWVMVRAADLTASSLIAAMEAGDFYASSGVVLNDVRQEGKTLSIDIAPEPGVTYVTEFFGTLRDYDATSQPVLGPAGEPLRVTRTYSKDIGVLLTKTEGTAAAYTLHGDEIYVRARITSSKVKADPSAPGEYERAWTQPLVNKEALTKQGTAKAE
jgi:hypothetical protein